MARDGILPLASPWADRQLRNWNYCIHRHPRCRRDLGPHSPRQKIFIVYNHVAFCRDIWRVDLLYDSKIHCLSGRCFFLRRGRCL